MKKLVKIAVDFETESSTLDETYVWSWGTCTIDKDLVFNYGNNIESFINFISNKNINYQVWIHNLKFDKEFLIYWLLKNNYEYVHTSSDRKVFSFTCMIDELGNTYSITIWFDNLKNYVKIFDSLKLLNMSIEKMAKAFNLTIKKGEIDYRKKRKKGHILTQEEIEYQRNDVEIMARALLIFFDQGYTKKTISSNALNELKKMVEFDKLFPQLTKEEWVDIKSSYKGGFVYVNPANKNKTINNIMVFDVNSLYPWAMKENMFPVGYPIKYEGKYKQNSLYPLYIQKFSCSFQLKNNKLPTIQIKNGFGFKANEYLESSDGDIITLTLTCVDLKLFFEHYDVDNIVYHYGYMFEGRNGLFTKYIDKYMQDKIDAKLSGNKGIYTISKLFLNGLYGKFGQSPLMVRKYPILEDDIVKYINSEPEECTPGYIPVATFTTSYARNKTIRTAQKIRDYTLKKYGNDYYIYSDTDSCHVKELPIEEYKQLIDIDTYKLGAWDYENFAKRGKFLRPKCYIEEINSEIKATIAGLPKNLSSKVNFKNFKVGLEVNGKLTPKKVKGGVVLVDTTFSIK